MGIVRFALKFLNCSLILGVPAELVREPTDQDVMSIANSPRRYVAQSRQHVKHLKAE
jgi:carbonic anhydrase/acetyltransferase-like protein (isoleucine patch superfamily)